MQFLYTEKETNDIKTVVSILSCGALESNNPYIESIMESCVSQNQKEILAVGLIGKKNLRNGCGNGKKYLWAESRIVYLSVCDTERKKSTVLKLLYNHF